MSKKSVAWGGEKSVYVAGFTTWGV